MEPENRTEPVRLSQTNSSQREAQDWKETICTFVIQRTGGTTTSP